MFFESNDAHADRFKHGKPNPALKYAAMNLVYRIAAAVLGAAWLATLAPAATAAPEPYEINAILSLTGNLAFVGADQLQALKALEGFVNKNGGIDGRPLSFVVADDQSDVKTSLQLAQGLIAKKVPIILGPSSPQACAAIAPLVTAGPVMYCIANAGYPVTGGYEFLTLFGFDVQFPVTLRYFRMLGMHKLAYITATDAGGLDAERAIVAAAALPENKDIQIVAREHFAPGDLSTTAQMARIKAANPDFLIAWATGTPAGTMFRSAKDIGGLDIPIATSPGNLNAAFFKQYGAMLPSNLYFATVPYYANNALLNPAVKTAIANQTAALGAIGVKPDGLAIGAWDPAVLLVDALRKLGPAAPAAKLHDYLVNLRGWVGVNGTYDFRANPQRGLGQNNVIMVKFTSSGNVAASKFGGVPLR
jgi:branched-chain amino acid transport system substrate-binding protein